MEVVTYLSGAKGKEAHNIYKEEDGSHMGLCFGLFFCMWHV